MNKTELVVALAEKASVKDGCISVNVKANSGEIWLPVFSTDKQIEPIKVETIENKMEVSACESVVETQVYIEKEQSVVTNKEYEEMTVEELQRAILKRMESNGPVTEQMKKDVYENIYHNSLVNWIKSFN